MACKYKYNDKWFTENELIYLIGEKKNLLDISNKQALERLNSLQEIFKQAPQLQEIGTIFDYDSYLDTIFPDSTVRYIVYRGVPFKSTNFDKKHLRPNLNAFYFTDNVDEAKYYGSIKRDEDDNVLEYGTLFPVLLNIRNPYNNQLGLIKDLENIKDYEIYYPDLRISNKTVKLLQDNNYDGYITQPEVGEQHNFGQTTDHKYKVVFEPEQIHILSSKKDLEMFKNFINFTKSEYAKYGDIQQFKDYIMSKNFAAVEEFLVVTNKIDRKC